MSDQHKTLVGALIAAQAEMGAVKKKRETTSGAKYKYATAEDMLNVIKPVLQGHGLGLVISVVGSTELDLRKTSNNANQYAHHVDLKLTLLHTSGENLSVYSKGLAQDGGDKALFQAESSARKYGLINLFNLTTTEEDVDSRLPQDDGGQQGQQQGNGRGNSRRQNQPPPTKGQRDARDKAEREFSWIKGQLEKCKTGAEVDNLKNNQFKKSIKALPQDLFNRIGAVVTDLKKKLPQR